MTEPLPHYRVHPRRYARRLPPVHARRVTLTIRITGPMKDAVAYLAAGRQMSPSEYLARLLSDHLAAQSQVRRR